MQSFYDLAAVAEVIRKEAAKRGMDPEQALRVARSEGLKPGVWQSDVINKKGEREQSFGPFQLYMGGGLGNRFQAKYGKSPADPSTVYDQIPFALDEAQRSGWGAWHGWKGDPWAGIKTPATANVSDPMDVGGMARGSKMAAVQRAETAPTDNSGGPLFPAQSTELQGDDKKKTLGGLLGEMLNPSRQQAPPLMPEFTAGAGDSGTALSQLVQQYMASQARGRPQQGGQGFG